MATGEPPRVVDLVTHPLSDLRTLDRASAHVLHIVEGLNAGDFYTLDQPETLAGRSEDCTLSLPEAGVSRRHALFRREGEAITVRDAGSLNGTFVNGARLTAEVRLHVGDRVRIGPVRLRYSVEDLAEVRRLRELHIAAIRDHLTGLFNRRYLEQRLPTEVAFANRHGTPIAVLVLDLDHFKRINDSFGHAAGDAALSAFGRVLAKEVRVEDVAGRFGGEEFLVLARGTDEAGAVALSERLMARVRELGIRFHDHLLRITVSIGVAANDSTRKTSAAELVHAADVALLEAKRAGRDRVSTRGRMARDRTLVEEAPTSDDS
jgi:two-component system cell cycle response regulator